MITGGYGFLGSHVLELFADNGTDDFVIPKHSDWDLTRQSAVNRLLADTRPNIVIHLAAEVGGIQANLDRPGRYFYANAVMGINLIEASRLTGIEKFIQVGTVCAYPKFTPVPFREERLWDGFPEETNAAYGIAKKSLLVMLQAYRQQYGFDGIYLLPTNLYGPEDNFDPETSHVIPALIRRIVRAKRRHDPRVTVWGTEKTSREFLHARDAARAIMLATERYSGSEPVNIGTGHETTVRDLALTIAKLVEYQGEIIWDASKPEGQPRRSLSVEGARELFGFEAEIELEEGLRETIAWWKATSSDAA